MRGFSCFALLLLALGSDGFQPGSPVTRHARTSPQANPIGAYATTTGSTSTLTSLWSSKGPSEDEDLAEARRRSQKINGTGAEGKTLMLFGLLLCTWFFTVPPEFRRQRLCDELQTAANPGVCMTGGQFKDKVVDYYANGGGIQWDFSIAQETKDYYDR